jgi:hypothetical protein
MQNEVISKESIALSREDSANTFFEYVTMARENCEINQDFGDFLNKLDRWTEFYTEHYEEFEKFADGRVFTCDCGGEVKVNTLYTDLKHRSGTGNPCFAELAELCHLLDMVTGGMPVVEITSKSICLKCYKDWPIAKIKQKERESKIRNKKDKNFQ